MKAWPLLIMLIAAPALAGPRDGLVPVDQAVADLDPLALSLRRVEAGLRDEGEQTSRLFAFTPDPSTAFAAGGALGRPVSPSYYRIGKGFVAKVDRITYLVRDPEGGVALNITPAKDGEFIEMIGANTVFDLRALDLNAAMPLAPTPPAPTTSTAVVSPNRVTGQIHTMIDGQVKSNRIEPRRVDNRVSP
jgi:hypothetical protein